MGFVAEFRIGSLAAVGLEVLQQGWVLEVAEKHGSWLGQRAESPLSLLTQGNV